MEALDPQDAQKTVSYYHPECGCEVEVDFTWLRSVTPHGSVTWRWVPLVVFHQLGLFCEDASHVELALDTMKRHNGRANAGADQGEAVGGKSDPKDLPSTTPR